MKKGKYIFLKIRRVLSFAVTSTAGLTFMASIACLDGSPLICSIAMLVSLAWLMFRAKANGMLYTGKEGATDVQN